ncbi:type II toxin-antitoxin system RelE/ParE family toxin [Neorhizobium huautlense]|nr:type II toxin-antitoxin system RelE/ParE family toxin [Neorhizobium huautlense]
MERCRQFLVKAGAPSSVRAIKTIAHHFSMLEQSPEIGRPASGTESLRELLIPFGHSGYVALYRFHPAEDIIYILAFRHQREAGY